MAKGSQLAQLKSALTQAGVVGNNNNKKRKRAAPTEKDKEKRAAKLDEIHRKLNPFDTKVTKLKHDVGGRKLKGVTGKPAQSKMAGIEQRKKTLLKEVEERGRAGGVVDRRFGENDPSMSLEERMLERFTRERQRAARGSAFNLEDEEELTHYGQSLADIDDFDNTGLGLDDDNEEDEGSGQIEKDIVKHTHFGGFDDDEQNDSDSEEPARKKSKAEVMAEVIAKSKEHKMIRQMEKEQGENVRHELDQAFDSLKDLLFAPDPSATGTNAIPLGVPGTQASEPQREYDQHVRELAFESRAKPKDRTKTEEELALEEKEALETAERKRKKRMLGLDDSDSEDEGKGRGKRQRGGDDLEDDFDEEMGYGLGAGLGDVDEGLVSGDDPSGEEEEDEDEDEDEENEDEDDEDAEDDGEEFSGIQEDDSTSEEEVEDNEHLVKGSKKSTAASKAHDKAEELPFTFPCPASHDEFLEIVEKIQDDQVPTVVKRIRTLHHASFASENKLKLQKLNSVLVDHILHLASPPQPKFKVINSLLPHLYALTKAYPIQSAEQFNEKLSIMHRNLKRGLSRGASNHDSKTWPGLPELTLLRIIGAVWPTSDMNHAVISPARILMGSYLGLGRVRALQDLASGLFLCTLFLQFEQLSKRYVPEAINFLVNAVLHLAPNRYKESSDLPGSFPTPDFRSETCRPLMITPKKTKGVEVKKPDLAAILSASSLGESDKLSLVALTLEVLGKFADLYKGLEAFIEIFEPILEICQNLDVGKLGTDIQAKHSSTIDMITRLLRFARQSRRPLMLQEHKPIPIPSYVPKFDSTSSSYLRAQDPDRERNEANKLRAQYKKERKGAIRELRKDARFLAGVEQAKQKEKDRGYNERMKRVFGSIESERAEQKSMEREKAKEKRRAGRK